MLKILICFIILPKKNMGHQTKCYDFWPLKVYFWLKINDLFEIFSKSAFNSPINTSYVIIDWIFSEMLRHLYLSSCYINCVIYQEIIDNLHENEFRLFLNELVWNSYSFIHYVETPTEALKSRVWVHFLVPLIYGSFLDILSCSSHSIADL